MAVMTKEEVKYIVLRNGIKVSDEEYNDKLDAQREYEHWKKIIKRFPDGSKLEIKEI